MASSISIILRECAVFTCPFRRAYLLSPLRGLRLLFTDAFDDWGENQFKTHIYNDGYHAVDRLSNRRPSGMPVSWRNMEAA